MSERAEPLASVAHLKCLECGRTWLDRTERWRVYLTNDDPPQPLAYCSECAEREFS